jgi:hypothetical protein
VKTVESAARVRGAIVWDQLEINRAESFHIERRTGESQSPSTGYVP